MLKVITPFNGAAAGTPTKAKTIDIIHATGFVDGNIGFQLCHERRHTIVDVKSFYIREIK